MNSDGCLQCIPFTGNSDGCLQCIPFTGNSDGCLQCIPFTGNSDGWLQCIPFTGNSDGCLQCIPFTGNNDGCLQWLLWTMMDFTVNNEWIFTMCPGVVLMKLVLQLVVFLHSKFKDEIHSKILILSYILSPYICIVKFSFQIF